MKKLNFWLLASLFVGSLAFIACSNSDGDGDGPKDPEPPQNPPTVIDPANMVYATISGVVRSTDWNASPMQGVKVTSGTQTTTTDLNGFYKFDQVDVKNNHAVVKFSKNGYIDVVRTVPYESGNAVRLDTKMTEAQVKHEQLYSSTAASDVYVGPVGDRVKVEFEGGFKDANGDYTGNVYVDASYLDPDDDSFSSQMPGDLSAIRFDGSPSQLVSYGMVAVNLTGDDGQKVEMADGKKATLTFPIPFKFQGGTPPATIPLWSFNETTGVWEEEGSASLVGDKYVGTVSHFSWHNLDSPELTAYLRVTVKDSNGNLLAKVPIDIDGQRMFYTDSKGFMKCDIPSNTKLYVRIPSDAYGNYAAWGGTEFKEEIQVEGDKTKEMVITIPVSAPRIYGVVNNTAGSNICALFIAYGMQQTASVMSDVNGTYSIFAPANYIGKAVLFARFADGSMITQDIVITKDDQRIDLVTSVISGAGTGMFRVINTSLGLNLAYALPAAPDGGLWTATVDGSGNLKISVSQEFAKDDTPMPEGLTPDEQWKWEEQHMQGGSEAFSFSVSGYSASQTEYSNANFEYDLYAGPHFGLSIKNVKATITLVNGVYNIKMEGVNGTFSDQMSGIPDNSPVKADVEFSAKAQ